MSQSLAVKYRPVTFEQVLGQSVTTKILKRAVETRNFKHCYLFSGNSGCGKTTISRCLAREINKGAGVPIEIDAASHGGVEDVRAIMEAGKQRAVDAEYKVFIIDECHAITQHGWNAFLLGLEEPSPYTIYIFCTTEPNKIPEAVLNRMQRYTITKISQIEIKQRLMEICNNEGFTNYEQACDLISKTTHGCMRDAIMKLEQCADFDTNLALENVQQVLSSTSFDALIYLTWALYAKDESQQHQAGILWTIENLYSSGADLKNFIELYLEFLLDLTKYTVYRDLKLTSIPAYLEQTIINLTSSINNPHWYLDLIDQLLKIKLEIRYDAFYKSTIEAFLLEFYNRGEA